MRNLQIHMTDAHTLSDWLVTLHWMARESTIAVLVSDGKPLTGMLRILKLIH